ncbi:unnamed protein product [Rotaria magnacalcarata]|nr:unnamed protein product [Rotaria magnacalcarata]CAF2217954.1 unnamed protein product [Rotaria magnacalcarata]
MEQLQKYRIQIAALSETCMYDSGVKLINDFTWIFSGLPSVNKTRNAHGVAICLDKTAATVWKDSGLEWEAVSERIVKIRLKCLFINLTIIYIYSPVNPINNQMNDDSQNFYNDLQDVINRIPTEDMYIIMGDFNARVGWNNQQQQNLSNSIGPYTVDITNENGEKLIDLCTINNLLIVTNTFFKHKLVHQTSWMHPGNKQWHMIDYTLVNKKFRSSIEDCRMYRKAAGAIGTDHHLMRIKIKLHFRSRRKMVQKKVVYDPIKMKNDNALKQFQKDLIPTLSDATDKTISIDEKYDRFVEHMKTNAEKILKIDKNRNRKRKEWLTDEILEIVEKKATAFVNWQNHRGTKLEIEYANKYKRLRKLAKGKIEKRQEEYWDEICEEIESSVKLNDPANAFNIIRRLGGKRKRIKNMPIKDKHGKLILNSADQLERWREFFGDLLNVSTAVDLQLIDQIKITRIEKNEEERQSIQPTISEVRKALNQMKSRKAPGNDEITADLLKAGGEPVIKWLHEIFSDIWKQEEMIEEWNLAILIKLFKKGDKQLCENYRGISLLSVTSKLFSRIILNRIQLLVNRQLLEAQSGFRSNRSTIDQIFILKLCMEKRREFNKPLFMCFIDISKAYDSVNRNLLWKVCRQYGISEKLVNLLKMLIQIQKQR